MPDTGEMGSGLVSELTGQGSSRKRFLALAGGTAAAGAVGALVSACGSGEGSAEQKDPGIPTADDLSIANFALLLELIESSFYSAVIDAGIVKDASLARLVREIREDEREHIDALSATVEQLGGTPVKDPKVDFEPAISKGEAEVLKLAAKFENLGAAAYLGQAPRIQAPDILALALSIHTVEARHAAALNEAAGYGFEVEGEDLAGSVPNGAFAAPLERSEVEKLLEPYLPNAAAEAKEESQ